MKRISFFFAAWLCAVPVLLPAQDAAIEERLNKLSAQIQDMADARDAQNKRIDELARQLRTLQDQSAKPGVGYASQEDLKQLAAKLQEIDEKRQQDNERIVKELDKLGKSLGVSTGKKPVTPVTPTPSTDGSTPTTPDKGYEYVIQSGDSLSAIARAYNEKGVKVTVDQILKANPGLKAEKMRVGQKIFIPSPAP